MRYMKQRSQIRGLAWYPLFSDMAPPPPHPSSTEPPTLNKPSFIFTRQVGSNANRGIYLYLNN